MTKGIYFVYEDIHISNPNGIEKKIILQKNFMQHDGANVEFIKLNKYNGTVWHYENAYSGASFIYFRKSTIVDYNFCGFFRKLKKDNPNIVVFMEIPTFPYEGEYGTSIASKIRLTIDHHYRKELKGLIDYVVVTGVNKTTKIWNLNAINVVNGIDVDSVSIQSGEHSRADGVVISCIAKFSPWHGYERIINGLDDYYSGKKKGEDVTLLFVGDGPELDRYRQLVDRYDLNDRVKFTGSLFGKQLDEIYNITDIGCCSLGRYKSGIDVIGDLKSREFMAKGIPMICGCDIDVLQNRNYPYAIYFPNDESAIDIQRIINFRNELLEKEPIEEIRKKIRNEAVNLIDFKMTFEPVLKVIRNIR